MTLFEKNLSVPPAKYVASGQYLMDLYHLYHLHHINYTVAITAIIFIITISLYLIKNILVCAQFCRFIVKLFKYKLPTDRNQTSDTLEDNQAQNQRQRRNQSQNSVVNNQPIEQHPMITLDLTTSSSQTSPLLTKTTVPVVFGISVLKSPTNQLDIENQTTDLSVSQSMVEKVNQGV